MPRRQPLVVLCLLLSALVSMGATPASQPADNDRNALSRLKALTGSPWQNLDVNKFSVVEWAKNADEPDLKNRWSLKKIEPAVILRLSNQMLAVQEAHTNQWLVGSITPYFGETTIVCGSRFKSLEEMEDAGAYRNLPRAPDGWTIRELARLPGNPTRVADDGSGKRLYILLRDGDLYRVDLPSGDPRRVLAGSSYAGGDAQLLDVVGLAIDPQHRFYIVVNQKDVSQQIYLNRVTIFRSDPVADDQQIRMKPWVQAQYPYGVDVFNHGVGHIAFGPDRFAYVASGSRTDSNEAGNDPHISKEGEVELTSCIWRLDPKGEHPEIEIFARGLRNPYGFCWDDRGRMIATDNGPNEDPPEELNVIEKGKHYGFPYQFSDWSKSPYPHTPAPPARLKLELPIVNVGPDGGGSASRPLATFDPHSSPTGIVYLGDQFPEHDRGTFLVPRFGPLLDKPEVGFDVLQVRLRAPRPDGRIEAEVKRWLSPVARPVDIHVSGGRVYVCEFSREATNHGASMTLPGRVLELTPLPR